MTCRYCGLATETELGHTTESECIEALEREVMRLKAALKATVRATPSDPLPGTAAKAPEIRLSRA